MKFMNFLSPRASLIAIAACCIALVPAPARAIVISLNPVLSVVNEGDSFGVDIWVSGLHAGGQDEIVSGFDLDILFSGSILGATGFTFSAALGGPDDVITSFSSSFGYADIFAVSFLSDDFLAGQQGGTVWLGQLQLSALNAGITLLTFGTDPVSGRNIVGRDALSLSPTFTIPAITVVRRVPEPGTLALFAFGVLALALCKRRSLPVPSRHRSLT
jgi:hypothetical protein